VTYKIVGSGDPILTQTLPQFDFRAPPLDPEDVAKKLFETMLASNHLSISASECGLPYRVLAIAANPGIVAFNPIMVDSSDDSTLLEEVCVTKPGLLLKVQRADVIKVRYKEPNGNVVTTKFVGLTARLFQHELDHLNGITFEQRAHPIHLEQALRKRKKNNRKAKKGLL